VDVIWHDCERMQEVMAQDAGVVVECFYNHSGYGGLTKVIGAGAGFVEQPVHDGEGLP
jgi:hypothetical protein